VEVVVVSGHQKVKKLGLKLGQMKEFGLVLMMATKLALKLAM